MKLWQIVLFSFVGLILSLVIFIAINWITYYNRGNESDNLLKATYSNTQNILGQVSLKVMDTAKIADKYTQSVKDIIVQALDARYGEEGSQATFQWIQENNPNVDPALFLKVQQIIESGRNEFQVNQTLIIDQCRVYQTELGYLWSGFWYRLVGYPKIDLSVICKPVISGHANKAYETKIDNGFIQ